jgi:hypothetical protein
MMSFSEVVQLPATHVPHLLNREADLVTMRDLLETIVANYFVEQSRALRCSKVFGTQDVRPNGDPDSQNPESLGLSPDLTVALP